MSIYVPTAFHGQELSPGQQFAGTHTPCPRPVKCIRVIRVYYNTLHMLHSKQMLVRTNETDTDNENGIDTSANSTTSTNSCVCICVCVCVHACVRVHVLKTCVNSKVPKLATTVTEIQLTFFKAERG